ncbi:nuclear pore complex protein Nup43 [Pelomyxa schiedti]|nr:nuclear pore complex protein Nup43 [Pelomyxa schiedti]
MLRAAGDSASRSGPILRPMQLTRTATLPLSATTVGGLPPQMSDYSGATPEKAATTTPSSAMGEGCSEDSGGEMADDGAAASAGARVFVGVPVARVRWHPQSGLPSTKLTCVSRERFSSEVSLWEYCPNSEHMLQKRVTQSFVGTGVDLHIATLDHLSSLICVTTTAGRLLCYRTQTDLTGTRLEVSGEAQVHNGQCTSVASNDSNGEIATGCADGSISFLKIGTLQVIHKIDYAESFTIQNLVFTNNDLISAGSCVKFWDLRHPTTPSVTLKHTVSSATLPDIIHSVSPRSGVEYMLAVGRSTGQVDYWDKRQTRTPLQTCQAHKSNVWRVQFCKFDSQYMASCGDSTLSWWNLPSNVTLDNGRSSAHTLYDTTHYWQQITDFDINPTRSVIACTSGLNDLSVRTLPGLLL